MDATLTTAALAGAEAIVQRALHYDPASRLALSQLSGQVLALHFTQPKATVYVRPGTEGLELSSHWEGEVQTRLTGRLWDFMRLARGEQTSLAGSGVQLEGSTGLMQELQRIAHQLEIDWEEALSQLFGDLAGHQGAEWLRTGSRWLQAREAQARRLATEFLTQEAAVLPSRPELEHFYNEVDELQMALDRAEARLNHLLQRRAQPNTPNRSEQSTKDHE